MKKLFASLALVLAICLNLNAQSNEGSYLGVRAIYDLMGSTSLAKNTTFGSGVSAGVAYHAPFGKKFYAEPGVYGYFNTVRRQNFGLDLDVLAIIINFAVCQKKNSIHIDLFRGKNLPTRCLQP